ncbi:MAG: long-chain fatty acid--CoA ligase [Burkholderiaceae bacterium]|nr:MAG: long-chain fatty acid--CoA ligase [Burkholderiaceae bacterium]TAM05374.1 MAG: long-chain fatty acid--CoA ligase [Pusillimonas sp.]
MSAVYPMPPVWPTVVHMLADAALQDPDGPALVCGGEALCYRQYAACVSGLAWQLQRDGLGEGDRVVVFMANSLDVAIALFAVQAAGAQVVPLNPAYTVSELNQVLQNANARGIIYDEAVQGVVDGLEAKFDRYYCVGNGVGTHGPAQRLTRWRDQLTLADALPLPRTEMPSILQYTGGTTGVPKGVSLRHSAVSTNVSQREALVPTHAGKERVLAITPLFHSYAMAMGLYLAAYARSALVIVTRYRPDTVLDAIAREHITLLLGSPTIFSGLMGYEGFAKADLSSLRLSSSGSSALSEETLRRWEASTGCVVCEGYGQTEAGPVLTYNPLNGQRKIGSVGVVTPETEVEIVDVQDGEKVLPVGEIGEIRARGPQVMSGYFGMPGETAQTLRDGWLYTGDIGRLDEEGYLFICDRKKEMVIVGGFNVYPREIEEVLYRHPAVSEVAVIGVPDSYRGEILQAYVVVADEKVGASDLQDFLMQRLVKYKWPAHIHMVNDLPRTSVGKIDKKRLRAMAAA